MFNKFCKVLKKFKHGNIVKTVNFVNLQTFTKFYKHFKAKF